VPRPGGINTEAWPALLGAHDHRSGEPNCTRVAATTDRRSPFQDDDHLIDASPVMPGLGVAGTTWASVRGKTSHARPGIGRASNVHPPLRCICCVLSYCWSLGPPFTRGVHDGDCDTSCRSCCLDLLGVLIEAGVPW